MIEPIGYKLNPKKLKKAPQYITPYLFLGAFYYTEDYEYFDVIKPYLDIPEKPKTLEEISQEFDEKIDKRIESIKHKFAELKCHQEYLYNQRFKRIIEDIEYARKNGSFPAKLDYSKLTATGGNITSNFVIKEGGKEVGYYTFGSGYLKYYMNKKPTIISRWFMKNCLSFVWIDVK
jgi:arginyl-tRNA synthetase